MSTRDVSSKQEELVARLLGGKTTPNSGAGHTKKGDILVGDFGIIECKTKMKQCDNITIKKEWIDTVRKEGFETGRNFWSIVFDFGNLGEEYAIVPLAYLKQLIDIIEEDR